MHDVLICALSLATGLAIAEYYNRGRIDAIRREQLDDLRGRRPTQRRRGWDDLTDDLLGAGADEHPAPRRSRDLISPAQHEEYRRTGATRGKRIDGVDM